jgi:kanamycin nucleotidyltransferase
MTREERVRLAHEIAERVLSVHGENIKAIGMYGSTARETDGPFSDLEMFCVLRSSGQDDDCEWAVGAWKAEVNFLSEDVLLRDAASVDGLWPLTHGKYFAVRSLHDPEAFFADLRSAAESPDRDDFRRAICGVIAGELYEFAGKWRNVRVQGPCTFLPTLAIETAKYGAMLVGLHHRRCFSTSARVLPEALGMSGRPAGFDALCRLVMAGDLSKPDTILSACESFWEGVIEWAVRNGYDCMEKRRIPF